MKFTVLKAFFILLFSVTISFTTYARVFTGLEMFLAKHTNLVRGKRVGLLTNPTATNSITNKTTTIDAHLSIFQLSRRTAMTRPMTPAATARNRTNISSRLNHAKNPIPNSMSKTATSIQTNAVSVHASRQRHRRGGFVVASED